MFKEDRQTFGPGLKVALLSGAMGLALAACQGGMTGQQTPVVLEPTADQMSLVTPPEPGAPAPTAAGHPDRGTVGGGPATGAGQTDDNRAAIGDPGAVQAPEDGDDVSATGTDVGTADDDTVTRTTTTDGRTGADG
jgi:hypothetical protein